MGYIVLSRKYRPKTFSEVVGQEHIVATLANAIRTDRVAHAYLFAGPRGVGKTSMARILSKALNCKTGPTSEPCSECSICESIANGNDIDVLEIDGASNRGIDEIRNIRQNVGYAPAASRYKIYIIDEVHMLTKEAFNAILKTLEEPPAHVKFIFATTSPNRVPDTVQSRCQRFDFKSISVSDISNRLEQICKAENMPVEEGVLQTIAKYAMGGLRDSESILDQHISFCHDKITLEDVYNILGVVNEEQIVSLIDNFINKQPELALKTFHEITESGKDVDGFVDQLLLYMRDLLLISVCGKDSSLTETISGDLSMLRKQASSLSSDTLMYMIQLISETKNRTKDLLQQKILLEVVMIKLATMEDLKPLDTVLDRIEDIKRSFESNGTTNENGMRITTVSDNTNVTTTKEVEIREDISETKETEVREELSGDYVDKGGKISQDAGLSGFWDKVMAEIKNKKKPTWTVLKSARVLNFDDNEVVLELPENYQIHKDRLEKPDEKRMIEECIEKVLGKKILVRLTISTNGRKISMNDFESKPETNNKQENSLADDPTVKKTLEIFEGSIVNIRRPEE